MFFQINTCLNWILSVASFSMPSMHPLPNLLSDEDDISFTQNSDHVTLAFYCAIHNVEESACDNAIKWKNGQLLWTFPLALGKPPRSFSASNTAPMAASCCMKLKMCP